MPAPWPFPEAIDNTMRTAFTACPTNFFHAYIRRKVLDVPQIHLHAGGAFAAGLHAARDAYYVQKASQEEAEVIGLRALWEFYGDYDVASIPSNVNKHPVRMAEAFASYTKEYPFQTDLVQPLQMGSRPAIEFSFAIPLPIDHPQTGDPILYTGRSDMVGSYGAAGFVVDEKTTQRLGPTWSKKWDLRSQFMGYTWACQQWGWDVGGAIIRGICIYADRIEHAQAIVYHQPWKLERWYRQLLIDINRMIEAWQSDFWEVNYADSCESYSGCAYARLCELENPEPFYAVGYRDNTWDPLAPAIDTKKSEASS